MTDFDIVTIAIDDDYSAQFNLDNYVAVAALVQGVFVGTRLRLSAATDKAGTFYPVADVVSVEPTAGEWCLLPLPEVFPFGLCKLWFDDGAGDIQTQTAVITITLLKKA